MTTIPLPTGPTDHLASSPGWPNRLMPADANPNLPHDVLPLDAFNIIPGAAFMLIDQPDPRVWIAERVYRDAATERVSLWAHDGTLANADDPHAGLGSDIALNLDYCYKVALVGLVVNHNDPDDNNWGAS